MMYQWERRLYAVCVAWVRRLVGARVVQTRVKILILLAFLCNGYMRVHRHLNSVADTDPHDHDHDL